MYNKTFWTDQDLIKYQADIRNNRRSTNQHVTSVKHLVIAKDQMKIIPWQINNFINLLELHAPNNGIYNMPHELCALTKLTKINLESNEISVMPYNLGRWANLVELNLMNNKIITLPIQIDKLVSLKKLLISGNCLTSVSRDLCELKNLKVLDLSGNKLGCIPKEITKMINLQKLKISFNQLIELPKELYSMASLKVLDATGNKLVKISKSVGNVYSLKKLLLAHNELTKIPDTIGNMINLSELELRGNKITTLPATIIFMQNLYHLGIDEIDVSSLNSPTKRFLRRFDTVHKYEMRLKCAYDYMPNININAIVIDKFVNNIKNFVAANPAMITLDMLKRVIKKNKLLGTDAKILLHKLCLCDYTFATINMTYLELLQGVIFYIINSDRPDVLFSKLNEKILASKNVCLLGMMTRLINVVVKDGDECEEVNISGTIVNNSENNKINNFDTVTVVDYEDKILLGSTLNSQ